METLFDYHLQWTVTLAFVLLVFSYSWVSPRFGVSAAAFFFFSCASALYVWVYVENRYLGLATIDPISKSLVQDIYTQLNLRYFACDSLAKALILIIPMMIASESKKFFSLGVKACLGFSFINSAAVIVEALLFRCYQQNTCGGIVGNPSISMSLTVCMLPIFFKHNFTEFFTFALVGAAVFLSLSSVAVGLFSIFCALWFLPWKRWGFKC